MEDNDKFIVQVIKHGKMVALEFPDDINNRMLCEGVHSCLDQIEDHIDRENCKHWCHVALELQVKDETPCSHCQPTIAKTSGLLLLNKKVPLEK